MDTIIVMTKLPNIIVYHAAGTVDCFYLGSAATCTHETTACCAVVHNAHSSTLSMLHDVALCCADILALCLESCYNGKMSKLHAQAKSADVFSICVAGIIAIDRNNGPETS